MLKNNAVHDCDDQETYLLLLLLSPCIIIIINHFHGINGTVTIVVYAKMATKSCNTR